MEDGLIHSDASPVGDAEWRQHLRELRWDAFVGESAAVWVNMERQRLAVIKGDTMVADYPCSTAKAGPGEKAGSQCTPRGWHEISECIGDNFPLGAVLQFRAWTGAVWDGTSTADDLILSRIMWLNGLEDGRNKDEDVDTHRRFIYIHGTPHEAALGTPASHGCIRLANRDVIDLFARVKVGVRVLITEH